MLSFYFISVFSFVFSFPTLTIITVLCTRAFCARRKRLRSVEKMSNQICMKEQFAEAQILDRIRAIHDEEDAL